jgi:hypothetical protein
MLRRSALIAAAIAFPAEPGSAPCTVGGFGDYLGVETTVFSPALLFRRNSAPLCSYPANLLATQVQVNRRLTSFPGVVRVSPEGKFGLVFSAATARPWNTVAVSFIDLQFGKQTPVDVTPPAFPQYLALPAGRAIANDGTAILAVTDGSRHGTAILLRPGSEPRPFPVPNALPLSISANASQVLYQKDGVHLLDLPSGNSTPLLPADQPAFALAHIRSRKVFPPLIESGTDPSPDVRFWCVFVLGSQIEYRRKPPLAAVRAVEARLEDTGAAKGFGQVRLEAMAFLRNGKRTRLSHLFDETLSEPLRDPVGHPEAWQWAWNYGEIHRHGALLEEAARKVLDAGHDPVTFGGGPKSWIYHLPATSQKTTLIMNDRRS